MGVGQTMDEKARGNGLHIAALASSDRHGFSKQRADALTLIAGIGVEGDAHAGATVKHRSRVARDASQPNLRQVYLIDTGFVAMLAAKGFVTQPGDIGENIVVEGSGLIDLPAGTSLTIGGSDGAVLSVAGLRNPCAQLDAFAPGLMKACLDRDADGNLLRLAGIMTTVVVGGHIRVGDGVAVGLPAEPYRRLGPV
jgi:MOSC domain-containing protein YiiM